jgi:predicted helicase
VIFVKRAAEQSGTNNVYYFSLRDPRSAAPGSNVIGKYQWLDAHSASSTQWQNLEPVAPYYLFVPRSKKVAAEYGRGVSLKELFDISGVGIVAGRDHLAFAFEEAELEERLINFMSMSVGDARERFELGKDSTAWSVKNARKDVAKHKHIDELIQPVLYRPFDRRFTYYTGESNGFLA